MNLHEISANYILERRGIADHAHGRLMTDREMRLDAECEEAPEPSVIYADIDERTGKFTAVTIVSRSE